MAAGRLAVPCMFLFFKRDNSGGYLGPYIVHVLQYVLILETQDNKAGCFEFPLTGSGMLFRFRISITGSVNFNYQFQRFTHEISHVQHDRRLPFEDMHLHLTCAKPVFPQACFRIGHALKRRTGGHKLWDNHDIPYSLLKSDEAET